MVLIFKVRAYENDDDHSMKLSFEDCDSIEVDTGDGNLVTMKLDNSQNEYTKFHHKYESPGDYIVKITFHGENPVRIKDFIGKNLNIIEVSKWSGYPIKRLKRFLGYTENILKVPNH